MCTGKVIMSESPIEPGAGPEARPTDDPEARPTDDPEITPSSSPDGGSTVMPVEPSVTNPDADGPDE
jgi:hypothetical protein